MGSPEGHVLWIFEGEVDPNITVAKEPARSHLLLFYPVFKAADEHLKVELVNVLVPGLLGVVEYGIPVASFVSFLVASDPVLVLTFHPGAVLFFPVAVVPKLILTARAEPIAVVVGRSLCF